MRKATIFSITRLPHMHNEAPGSKPVIRILTDLPSPHKNCFYITPLDHGKQEVHISLDRSLPEGTADSDIMNPGDTICFDMQHGIQKMAVWNDRRFRQRGYSFDFYAPLR